MENVREITADLSRKSEIMSTGIIIIIAPKFKITSARVLETKERRFDLIMEVEVYFWGRRGSSQVSERRPGGGLKEGWEDNLNSWKGTRIKC